MSIICQLFAKYLCKLFVNYLSNICQISMSTIFYQVHSGRAGETDAGAAAAVSSGRTHGMTFASQDLRMFYISSISYVAYLPQADLCFCCRNTAIRSCLVSIRTSATSLNREKGAEYHKVKVDLSPIDNVSRERLAHEQREREQRERYSSLQVSKPF